MLNNYFYLFAKQNSHEEKQNNKEDILSDSK